MSQDSCSLGCHGHYLFFKYEATSSTQGEADGQAVKFPLSTEERSALSVHQGSMSYPGHLPSAVRYRPLSTALSRQPDAVVTAIFGSRRKASSSKTPHPQTSPATWSKLEVVHQNPTELYHYYPSPLGFLVPQNKQLEMCTSSSEHGSYATGSDLHRLHPPSYPARKLR